MPLLDVEMMTNRGQDSVSTSFPKMLLCVGNGNSCAPLAQQFGDLFAENTLTMAPGL